MSFWNKFKEFLGFHKSPEHPDQRFNQEQSPSYNNTPWGGFNMFTDPLEIHKYFEQQMNEMLRNFGFNEFGDDSFFGRFENFANEPNFFQTPPSIGDPSSQELRDQFLKSGFENEKYSSLEKFDKDLDKEMKQRNFNSLFDKSNQTQIQPYDNSTNNNFFFGQSIISKTKRNPDGSIEITKTIKDASGNEETITTIKKGDQEYSITKRKDKNGKEEIIENMLNLDENDLNNFFITKPKLE